MERAAYHIATREMTDIFKRMWDMLYDCDRELRTTRATDPRSINKAINDRIAATFETKVNSAEFRSLEEQLGKHVAIHGEGLSQYAISRAMAHIFDQTGELECNGRFVRMADNTLTQVANRQLSIFGKSMDFLTMLRSQIENQWAGRSASGLRPPLLTHRAIMLSTTAAGVGLLSRGTYNVMRNEGHEPLYDNKNNTQRPNNIIVAAELLGGLALAKWGATGKVMPTIHRVKGLG